MAVPKKVDPRTATDVDGQIGARIRARRLQTSMSQEALAKSIGVTFQQIQKYEKGVNRVSARTLIDIAAALNIHPKILLPVRDDQSQMSASSTLDDPEFALLLSRLNVDGRRLLKNFARSMADDDRTRLRKRGE